MSKETLQPSRPIAEPNVVEVSSIEALLKNIDPAPDAETEQFVAAIYADRREAERRAE